MKKILEKVSEKVAELNQPYRLEWRYAPQESDEPADPPNATYDPSWPIWTTKPPFPLRPWKKCWFYTDFEAPAEHCGLKLGEKDLLLKVWGWFPFTLWIDGKELFKEEHVWKGTGPIADPVVMNPGKYRLVLCVEPGQLPNIWPEQAIGSGPLHMDFVAGPAERVSWWLDAARLELEFAEALAANDAERALVKRAAALIDTASLARNDWDAVKASVDRMETLLAPTFHDRARRQIVHVVGHTHLDMDWMWTWPETVRCIRRDFKAITDMMDDYPETCFTHSQVPTYQVVQQMDPDIFAKVQRFVAEGRWECVAGTWVEGDLNMADGEAIARQILYAKQWTRANLGVEAKIMWEPDTFGHPGNMPQIARLGEMDGYFHWRCNPDDRDFIPVRHWQGFDGTAVLTANSRYGGGMHPSAIFASARWGMRHGTKNTFTVMGWGDHGGGYNRMELSYMEEYRNRPITPTICFNTMGRFLEAAQAEGRKLPSSVGETFFMYSGCFTSAAQIKKDNRFCESLLLSAEALCAMAGLDQNARLREAWTPALFNQFHDLLDGSAIKGSYADTHRRAVKTLQDAAEISGEAMVLLAPSVPDGRTLTLVNPTAFNRTEPVRLRLPEGTATLEDERGELLPVQRLGDEHVFVARDVPAFSRRSYRILRELPAGVSFPQVEVKTWGEPDDHGVYRFRQVETDSAVAVLDTVSGAIGSYLDKRTGRELIGAITATHLTGDRYFHHMHNGLNVFQLIDERPHPMSSWVIGEMNHVSNLLQAERVEVVEAGPVFARIRVAHAFRSSRIEEDVLFYRQHPRVDFDVSVDWRELASPSAGVPMLKVSFNASMTAPRARFEGPFTIVERPVDGRELPTQKFLHVRGQEFGYTLLNDCKYGCDVLGGRARITLLRNPACPDPDPDTGAHTMRFTFQPHAGGDVPGAELFALGVAYNRPMRGAITDDRIGRETPLVVSNTPEVVITSLCRAQRSDRLQVRLFETGGQSCSATLTFRLPVRSTQVVNFLENPTGESAILSGHDIHVDLHPWEVKTLLVDM